MIAGWFDFPLALMEENLRALGKPRLLRCQRVQIKGFLGNEHRPKDCPSFPVALPSSFPRTFIIFNKNTGFGGGNDFVSSFVSIRFRFPRHRVQSVSYKHLR